MAQMYAIIYNDGPLRGEVKSYATVVADPLDTTKYHVEPVDDSPNAEEMWDKIMETIVPNPTTIKERIDREKTKVRRLELKEILKQRPWTPGERDEAIAELL